VSEPAINSNDEPTLASQVHTLAARPTSSIVAIDPETAARWLTHNGANRNVRTRQVIKYANDMLAGRWKLTGAPIQFAGDGRLLDGQHRLHAVVRAGVTVPMFVVRGLPTDAQSYMDTGAKRTVSDQLGIAGYQYATVVAAGGKLALLWTTGRLAQSKTDSISDSEIRNFVENNEYLIEAARFTTRLRRMGLDLHPSVVCAVFWALVEAGHDEERVLAFFSAMAEMRSDGPGDPKHALLQRIATARRSRQRIESPQMLSMVIRAYNADYTGKKMRNIPVFTRNEPVDVPPVVSPKAWRIPSDGSSPRRPA
jgi:hypothetical protein